jgi:hypothetical protein
MRPRDGSVGFMCLCASSPPPPRSISKMVQQHPSSNIKINTCQVTSQRDNPLPSNTDVSRSFFKQVSIFLSSSDTSA